MKKLKFAFPIFAFIWSVARMFPVFPAIMQDEYLYSVQARYPLEPGTEPFPNYLYSALYSTTSIFGSSYYQAAKVYNSIFFAILLVFVFLIARRIVGENLAIFVTTATALSSMSLYVAYFMPEMMYFTLMLAVVWLAQISFTKGKLPYWLATAGLLGVAALVKPHALFALPALLFMIFMSFSKKSDKKISTGLLASVASLISFFLVKFSLGFILAGAKALTIFGVYTDGSSGQASTSSEFFDLDDPNKGKTPTEIFSAVAIPHALTHLSWMTSLLTVAFVVAIGIILNLLRPSKDLSETGFFVSFSFLVTISFALVIALFEGYVSASGDNHSDRIIFRYYEFVVPLLILVAFAMAKYKSPSIGIRFLQAGIAVISLIFLTYTFGTSVDPQFADSGMIVALINFPGVAITSILIQLAIIFSWIVKPAAYEKIAGFGLASIVVLTGLFAQSSILKEVGTQAAYFDIAGQVARDNLSEVPGNNILVAGGTRTEVFVAKFWIDRPGIKHLLAGQGSVLHKEDVSTVDYVLLLKGLAIDAGQEVIQQGDDFALVRIVR